MLLDVLGPLQPDLPSAACRCCASISAVLWRCSKIAVAEPNEEDVCALPAPILSILRQPRQAYVMLQSNVDEPTLLEAGIVCNLLPTSQLRRTEEALLAITRRSGLWQYGN